MAELKFRDCTYCGRYTPQPSCNRCYLASSQGDKLFCRGYGYTKEVGKYDRCKHGYCSTYQKLVQRPYDEAQRCPENQK